VKLSDQTGAIAASWYVDTCGYATIQIIIWTGVGGAADRSAVIAVTTEALAGRGGMPGLLWSNAWLTEALDPGADSPDEASFADTIPLTKIRPAYYSPDDKMRGRLRQVVVPGDRAA
jgi:hypothetical protein